MIAQLTRVSSKPGRVRPRHRGAAVGLSCARRARRGQRPEPSLDVRVARAVAEALGRALPPSGRKRHLRRPFHVRLDLSSVNPVANSLIYAQRRKRAFNARRSPPLGRMNGLASAVISPEEKVSISLSGKHNSWERSSSLFFEPTPWPSCQRSPASRKRPCPPANPRLASRRGARRRTSDCGAFAFSCVRTNPQAARQISCRDGKSASPGNGAATEASKPQDLVHGRAADRALRLRAARMTKLTNSTRGETGGKFSGSQSIEIARNRARISKTSPPSVGSVWSRRRGRLRLFRRRPLIRPFGPPSPARGEGVSVNTPPPTGSTCPRASGRRRR